MNWWITILIGAGALLISLLMALHYRKQGYEFLRTFVYGILLQGMIAGLLYKALS